MYPRIGEPPSSVGAVQVSDTLARPRLRRRDSGHSARRLGPEGQPGEIREIARLPTRECYVQVSHARRSVDRSPDRLPRLPAARAGYLEASNHRAGLRVDPELDGAGRARRCAGRDASVNRGGHAAEVHSGVLEPGPCVDEPNVLTDTDVGARFDVGSAPRIGTGGVDPKQGNAIGLIHPHVVDKHLLGKHGGGVRVAWPVSADGGLQHDQKRMVEDPITIGYVSDRPGLALVLLAIGLRRYVGAGEALPRSTVRECHAARRL